MAARAGNAPPLTGAEQALMDVLLPVVEGEGAVVEEVRVLQSGRRRLVRVLVDRDPFAQEQPPDVPVDGLSLDEVADVSRAVGARLDELGPREDPLEGQPYTLEVSSPGVDRPLTLPRHFRRNVGRLVDLHRREGAAVRGRIAAATPDAVVLTTDSGDEQLAWADVASAAVQVEFRRSGGNAGGHSGDHSGDLEG